MTAERRTAERNEGVEFQEEAESEEVDHYFQAREPEPLFCCGCRLRSNFLEMEKGEPLFVMELTLEKRSRAR
jgi:TPP-dependent indolepyruvate ferredoxin oxidoreductase alpha subunit